MSSGTAVPPPMPGGQQPPVSQEADTYDAFIERRLRQTRRQVKGVDIAAGIITLLVGVLVYLLMAALIDHWLVTGGLGFGGRLFLLLGLLAAAGTYTWWAILPAVLGKINPVYAAQTIEQCQPSLKNSLINFLLLRGHRREVSGAVYQAMQQRAAADLSQVEIEAAVDRRHVIRSGYVLAGVMAVFALYLVLSPKSPLTSVARVIWPFSSVKAPTRVTIDDVAPGNVVVYHGDKIDVSARVDGLADDEPVTLRYTTADGQTVDATIEMNVPKNKYLYECRLPPSDSGLQQDVEYRIVAGDCRSARFQVEVRTAPAITVDRVEYEYPAYTGLGKRVVERQGDIRAIEGTKITVAATANQPIGWAEIDLDCDGRQGLKMRATGQNAVGQFKLRMSTDDPNLPEHDSYQVRFADVDGTVNRRPIRYGIEVIRDLPPQVQLLAPVEEEVRVPLDGAVDIQLQAEDPDFALSKVILCAELDEQRLSIEPLLDETHGGPFEATYAFEPSKLGLKVDDRVAYWVEAEDNKQPEPNRALSAQRWIVVTAPEVKDPTGQQPGNGDGNPLRDPEGQPQERPGMAPGEDDQLADDHRPKTPEMEDPAAPEQPPQPGEEPTPEQSPEESQSSDDQKSDEPGADQQGKGASQDSGDAKKQGESQPGQQGEDGQQGEGQNGESGEGEQNNGQQQGDQQSGQNGEGAQQPIDKTDEGGAFEEILKHMQQQGNQGDQQQPEGGEQNQDGEQPQDGQQPDGQQKGDQQPSGGAQGGGKPSADQQQNGDGTQPNDGQSPAGPQGAQQQGNSAAGDQPSEGQQDANQSSGDQPQEGTSPSQQSNDQQMNGPSRSPQSGEPSGDQRQPGEQAVNDRGAGDPKAGKPEGTKGDGAQSTGADGDPDQQQAQQQGEERPDAKGGDPESSESHAGSGKPSTDSEGTPSPQHDNRDRQKQSSDPGQNPGEGKPEEGKSPTTSPKQSDAKGDTAGDRSGGGQEGGGQRSNQSGTGTAGNNTEADQGGSKGKSQGEGETGSKAGDQVETDQQTGRSAKKNDADGSGRQQQRPGGQGEGQGQAGQKNDNQPPGTPQQNPQNGGTPGDQFSKGPGAHGQGNPTTGGADRPGSSGGQPGEGGEPGGTDPNLEYAQEQTDLALEHLRDQLAKQQPDPELLDRLGWSREELAEFARRWQQMKRSAKARGARGEEARHDLTEALRSLGLRPGGTQLDGKNIRTDQLMQRESRRIEAPADWSELYRAYSRGVAGEGR